MSGARQAVGALVLAALVGATLAPSAVAEDGGKDEAKAVKAAERDYLKAARLMNRKKYDAAIELFEKALPWWNEGPDIFYNLTQCAVLQKRWKKVALYGLGFLYFERAGKDARGIKRHLKAATAALAKKGQALVPVEFELQPAGLDVLVNGVPVGSAGGDPVLLPPGKYTAGAKKEEHVPWKAPFELKAGQAGAKVTGQLSRLIYKGKLQVTTQPGEGVEVFIDDKLVGTTPLKPLELETRRVLVRFQKEGYDRWVRYVTVERDKTITLDATLERTR